MVLVADSKLSLKVTGLGDVLAPSGGVIGEKQCAQQTGDIIAEDGSLLVARPRDEPTHPPTHPPTGPAFVVVGFVLRSLAKLR